jgi:hypothetical protein
MGTALSIRASFILEGVHDGYFCKSKAAAPDTIGVATDVPDIVVYGVIDPVFLCPDL